MTAVNHQHELIKIAGWGAGRVVANPKVVAVLLTGSVGEGACDGASDIDLIVYLNEPFSSAEFDAEVGAARASGGNLFGGEAKDFAVFHYHQGCKVDFAFGTVSDTQAYLDKLVVAHEPDAVSQQLAHGILSGKALSGENVIAELRARLNPYPPALAVTAAKASLRFMPTWVLREMGAARGDALLVYEHLLPTMNNLGAVLAAINRRYYPGKLKGLLRFAAQLPIAPRDFVRRAQSLFARPLDDIAVELDGLVRETLDLVDKHMPDVDTKAARQSYAREFAQYGAAARSEMPDADVRRAIPHRPPFLFADRIVEQTETRIVTERLIRADEPHFKGHYPEFPLMPGVLLCEACFQAGAIMLGSRVAGPESGFKSNSTSAENDPGPRTPDPGRKFPMVTRIQDAKFKNPVFPGETIRIAVNLDEKMGNAYLMTGKVTSGEKKVLTVQFIVAMVAKGVDS